MFDESHVIYRYKYLPFSEGSLKAITEGTMKFTCPLEFNDPFDCFPHYDTSHINHAPKLRPELFKAAGDRRGLSPAQRLQQKGQFVARLKTRIEDDTFANDLLRQVGVVSLSKNGLNILMWSHYAQQHRGFVLEFRIPVMGTPADLGLATDRLLPFPVKYKLDRPVIQIGASNTEGLVETALLTKSIDWKYEAEERVISEDRQPGIFPYRRDDILCSVIAGMRMSEANYKTLESAVYKLAQGPIPNLKLFKATPKRTEYKLEVPGHPRVEKATNQISDSI
jgi:Protein of unknown function (DUF2971)